MEYLQSVILDLIVEIRDGIKWHRGAREFYLEAVSRCDQKRQQEVRELLDDHDRTKLIQAKAIRDIANDPSVPRAAAAKLLESATKYIKASGDGVVELLSTAAAMMVAENGKPANGGGRKPDNEVFDRRKKVMQHTDEGLKPGDIAAKLQIDTGTVYSDRRYIKSNPSEFLN